MIEQTTTIINLYNSGINPEVIALELDIQYDTVMEVIRSEQIKNKEDLKLN